MAEGGTSDTSDIILIPASPPKNLSFEDIMKIQSQMNDLALFHTIALSDTFEMKIENPEKKTVEVHLRNVMQQAFWDLLQQRLDQDPPDFEHALTLLQEIKEKLIGLLLNGAKSQQLKQRIDEVIDVKLIRQQIENKVFDFKPYSSFIIEIMALLCAPERDEIVSSLKNIDHVVPLYKQIYEVLELLYVDFSNFEIKKMQPIIKAHSIEAERDLFIKILNFQKDKGIDGLMITKEWLKRNITSLNDKKLDGELKVKVAEILNASYVDLVQVEYYPLPETVALDKVRIDSIREQISVMVFIAATIAIIRSTFNDQICNESLRIKLKNNLSILCKEFNSSNRDSWVKGIAEHVINTLKTEWSLHTPNDASFLPNVTQPFFFDAEKQEILTSQIISLATLDKQHPVLTVLMNRIMSFLLEAFGKNINQHLPLPLGFNLFSQELLKIIAEFRHIFDYNKKVFGPLYEDLIKHLIKDTTI